MYAIYVPKKTQEDLLEEAEYKDYEVNCELNPRGIAGHLLMGHGPELKDFEKRDIATVKNLTYDAREKAS